jgi:chemotaxis protein methyltransferase CheR
VTALARPRRRTAQHGDTLSRERLEPAAHLGSSAGSRTLPVADRRRLARIAELVTRELGIRMPLTKLPMLYSRIERRMRQLDLDSLAAYDTRLFGMGTASTELVQLFDIVTTNKTDFFREPAHFTYLTEVALPTLSRERGSDRWHCKVWCAGCSTGMEVYTLAMVLAEYAEAHPGFTYSLVGTDISTRVLGEARRAVYSEAVLAPVPATLKKKYLLRSKDRSQGLARVGPALRAKVDLQRLNFMDGRYPLPADFDVVFFRNVMIYFDRPTQQDVIQRQCRHLKLGGYHFTGHSESIADLDVPLQALGGSVARKVA